MRKTRYVQIALISMILIMLLTSIVHADESAAVIDKGMCGDNLTWTLTEDWVLEISGKGAMWDYEKEGNTAPWHQYLDDKENKTTLKLNDGITSIGSYAFYECYGLVGKLYIPDSVTAIGNYAFYNCPGLTGELVIPNSVTTIVGYAFYGCSGFKGNLSIPDSVTEIGWDAFHGCSGFSGTLSLSSNLKTIEGNVFSGCTGLTGNLNIPYGVTLIEWGAFEGCSGFSGQLAIPSSVTLINGYAFAGCSHLKGDLIIPNGVTKIAWSAFSACSGFTGSLSLPYTLEIIEGEAFKGCSGLSGDLLLPESIKQLDGGAFDGCEKITRAYLNFNAPQSGGLIFGDREDSFKLYCKKNYRDSYITSDDYDKDLQTWQGYSIEFYGDSTAIPVESDHVSFGIVPMKGNWSADGKISEGEYGEIQLEPEWMSYAMWSDTKYNELKNLGEKLYMSWDSDYIYLASVYTPKVHSCIWDDEPSLMWYSGCMQIGVARYGETGSETRNEYGIGLSSVTNQNLYITWADGNGTGYKLSADDAKMFLDGGTITCETRIPWTAIDSNGYSENTKGLNLGIVWSVGVEQNYEHIQLASGITGFGKHAEDFAKVSLITELDLLCEEVTEKLDDVIQTAEGGADTEVLRESVQEIGKDKLHEAMAADSDNTGVVQQLQTLEESTGATVSVDVAENVDDFDESLVSVTGALLNPLVQDEVTLSITKPQINAVIPEEYADSTVIRFGMELEGVKDPSDLAVPVKITLPIPDSMDPARLIILHYPANGGSSAEVQPEEIITPNVFEKDGQWYASFVLDHFSDFVMAMEMKTILIGDVNQDGSVDATDRMILSRYLAKWDGYAAKIKSMDAADIDRNGLVEAKDRMILARYLAKWTGYDQYFK